MLYGNSILRKSHHEHRALEMVNRSSAAAEREDPAHHKKAKLRSEMNEIDRAWSAVNRNVGIYLQSHPAMAYGETAAKLGCHAGEC